MIAELVETGEAGARLLTAWNIEHHYRLPHPNCTAQT
jgi:hypothetical protein